MSDANRADSIGKTEIDAEEENLFRSDKLDPGKPAADDKGDHGADASQTEDEALDEALEETFPASDPVQPHRIDGPGN